MHNILWLHMLKGYTVHLPLGLFVTAYIEDTCLAPPSDDEVECVPVDKLPVWIFYMN